MISTVCKYIKNRIKIFMKWAIAPSKMNSTDTSRKSKHHHKTSHRIHKSKSLIQQEECFFFFRDVGVVTGSTTKEIFLKNWNYVTCLNLELLWINTCLPFCSQKFLHFLEFPFGVRSTLQVICHPQISHHGSSTGPDILSAFWAIRLPQTESLCASE